MQDVAGKLGIKQDANILILLPNGLRSFVFAEGAIRVLKQAFQDANIVLLTSVEGKPIAEASGYFSEVMVDEKYHWSEINEWWGMRRRLVESNFDLVIDLENSIRTHWYFKLAGRTKPKWSCTIPWCSFPYSQPEGYMDDEGKYVDEHVVDSHAGVLTSLGIGVDADDVRSLFAWVDVDVSRFKLASDYALIVPVPPEGDDELGWDVEHYVDLIEYLEQREGVQSVLIGERRDALYARQILTRVVGASPVNLIGKASDIEVAQLAKKAHFSVGNDQALMSLIAYMGCKAIFMFSQFSNCARWLPLRSKIRVIQSEFIRHVPIQTVFGNLNILLGVDSDTKTYTSEGEEQPLTKEQTVEPATN